jgi:hypothetical protein
MSDAERVVFYAGCALAVAILAVGPASREVVRHVIQAAPLMLFCVVAARRPEVLRWLLGPVMLFWLLIAVLIWLFLLHLARVVTGTFNPMEIAMTFVMGAAAIVGFAYFPRVRRRFPLLRGLALVAFSLALQVGAFAISIQPWVAHADGHEVSDAGGLGTASGEAD